MRAPMRVKQPLHTCRLALPNGRPCAARVRRPASRAVARAAQQAAVADALPSLSPPTPERACCPASGLLCDLDGVIFTGDQVLPGAVATVHWLKECGTPLLFLTNTTFQTRDAIAQRLRGMGLPIEAGDIINPSSLAADWLRTHCTGPVALFVDPSTVCEYTGLDLLPPDAEEGAAAVVLGDLGPGWDYEAMNRAFRLLMQPAPGGCGGGGGGSDRPVLIALGKSRYYRDGQGRMSLDVGPFAAALEYATNCSALVLGKPDAAVFQQAAQRLGVPAAEVVMVGDDVLGDVRGAQAAGLRGLLVRTGKYRPEDLLGPTQPDGVLDSIVDLPGWWRQQQLEGML